MERSKNGGRNKGREDSEMNAEIHKSTLSGRLTDHVTKALLTLSERCQIWDARGTLRGIVGSKTFIRKVVNVIVYQHTSRSEESQAPGPQTL